MSNVSVELAEELIKVIQCRQMNFFRLLFGVMAGGLLVLGRPSVVLANGGGLHVGTTHIPGIVVWIGGGLMVTILLLFFIGWGLSSRARRHSQQEETENNFRGTNGEKE